MDNNSLILKFNRPFTTESGFTFPESQIAYRSWGKLNKNRDNVILICHALTGNQHADEWFHGFFKDQQLFDLSHHFVICANVLGSSYGSTGPQSINPETGKPYQGDFPVVSIRDMVRFLQQLLDHLKINKIQLAIGGSMGGMQVLELSVMDKRLQSMILLGMDKAHSAWAIGLSETQRQAIYADPNWNNGFYSADNPPRQGLATARMIAMLSYRTSQSFEQRFGRKVQDESNLFQIESYLNYQGQKLVNRFDAVSYIRLTQAMDTHDVARGRGTYEEVLGNVAAPALIIGIDSDILYPTNEQRELASLLPNADYSELQSTLGHDAFLLEFSQMQQIFDPFLQKTNFKITVNS